MGRNKQIAARMKGDDYQALLFWKKALRLLYADTKAICAGFELSGAGGFDDVFLESSTVGSGGQPDHIDLYQAKFHVRDAHGYGYADLIDAKHMSSGKASLLQRLHATCQNPPPAQSYTCILYSPQIPVPGDPLAGARSNVDGSIEWAKLPDKVREVWRKHLALPDLAELERVIAVLRLEQGPTLGALKEWLTDDLRHAGVAPDVDTVLTLYRKLLDQGELSFHAQSLQARLHEAGLWRGGPTTGQPTARMAVRTRLAGAELLDTEVDDCLCLCDRFLDRDLREEMTWSGDVWPAVTHWLSSRRGSDITLHLGAVHSSLAAGLGWLLDTKSGVRVTLVQSGLGGDQPWPPAPAPPVAGESGPDWAFGEQGLASGGAETALAICATWDIEQDVANHCGIHLPAVGRLVSAKLPSPGPSAVNGPAHVQRLVERLVAHLQRAIPAADRRHNLHLFSAAPNALLFRLGQHLRGLGPTQCYEFGFDTTFQYTPSLRIPPPAEAAAVGQGG